MTEFEMIAKTFQGLEEILAKELTNLGANNICIGNRMVSFKGDKALMYKANFNLRTALRILKPFLHFKADDADQVYEICKKVEWDKYMDLSDSFAVDAVVNSEDFRHSKFVAYRVKDAIADWFRDKYGKRPNVSVANPDLTFHIHISHDDCSLSLDSSGESLHKRGYKMAATEAPINEVLAAGMVLMSGWDGKCDFVDPMCGSGTIAIEAALIALNMAPGLFRTSYAFEKWKDFDRDLFEAIYNDDSQERPFEHSIIARDKDPKAINIAKANAKAAGLQDYIKFDVADFKDFEAISEPAVMITNPPYGERLNDEHLLELYAMIGERLKHAFKGGQAWIISYHFECFDKIGLKPSAKIPLFNGQLPCELRKYEIFDGRYNDFRGKGSFLDKTEPVSRRSQTLRHKAREKERLQKVEDGVLVNGSERSEHVERKPFNRNGKPFSSHNGENHVPFGNRSGKSRKPFDGKRWDRERDERKPFSRNSERKPFGSQSGESRKPFGGKRGDSEHGPHKPFAGKSGNRKPFSGSSRGPKKGSSFKKRD